MTFFKNLFGSSSTNANQETVADRPIVTEDLFVNAEAPSSSVAKSTPKPAPTMRERLSAILDVDFEAHGYRDAINYQSDSVIALYTESLKTRIIAIYEDGLAEIESQMANWMQHQNSNGDELIQLQLKTKITMLERKDKDLRRKVDEVREGKGDVAHPIFSYRMGFKRGYEDFLEEFGNSNLFNN